MGDRPKENESGTSISVGGFETQTTETVSLNWPTFELKTGDVVELRVLPEGEGDQPSEIRKSSESPYNLFSSTELAKQMLQAVSEFERRLPSCVANRRKWSQQTNTRNVLQQMPMWPGS